MPHRQFTFRETAELFCQLDGRPDTDVTAVTVQVKGLHDRGLLTVSPYRAARGANQIDRAEMVRARLLLVLIELGLESGELDRANAHLERGGRTVVTTGGHIQHDLRGLIAACGRSENWVLRVNMGRDRLSGGKLTFSVKLLPASMAAKPLDAGANGDPTHPESNGEFLEVTHLAYVKIPASQLASPILSHLIDEA